jgi:1,4-dihydroxy-2-naphthoyl-CoA hydrolase
VSSAQADGVTEGFELPYGLELAELGDDRWSGTVVVRDELKQASGAVHAGVFAAIAESLTAAATARAVAADSKAVAPLSSQTSFLRPITNGVIRASAVAKHRGKTTWVWEVEFADDQGRLCVQTRMTVAVGDATRG